MSLSSKLAFFGLCLFLSISSMAQIDGDNIFGQDQIISIDLTFADGVFWNTLTSNYELDDIPYESATLVITDMTGTYTIDSVGIRLKGNSSYSHPGNKKSFKIDFNEYIAGQNYDGLKKLNLSNGFKDPSCIREKLFFDVCREAGVKAPRASFANVTMNGTPWGFYTVVEQIDDQFLDWAILDDDGNLFKAGDNFGAGGGGAGGGDEADLLDYGSDQSAYEEKYELKTNEIANDWSDLIDFIDFINNTSDADFQSQLSSRLDLPGFLRSAALDNMFANLDTYTGSARNYYIYHNLTTGLWEWIKWDGNECFGAYTNGVNNITGMALDYSNANRPLLERIFDDPVLYDMYLQEVCDITENWFNSDYMDEQIDATYALVQSSVYADANKMYSNANFDDIIESNLTGGGGGPGGGTTYGLKPFIATRANSINSQVDCALFNSVSELNTTDFSVFPNPSTGEISLRLERNDLRHVDIIDTYGRVILTKSVKGLQQVSIDLMDVSKGLYIVRLTSENGSTAAQKLVLN